MTDKANNQIWVLGSGSRQPAALWGPPTPADLCFSSQYISLSLDFCSFSCDDHSLKINITIDVFCFFTISLCLEYNYTTQAAREYSCQNNEQV